MVKYVPAVECPELHHCTAQCLSESPPQAAEACENNEKSAVTATNNFRGSVPAKAPRMISVGLLLSRANAMRTVLCNANKCAPRGRHMPARVRKLQLKTDMNGFYLSTTSRALWLRAKCILRALTGEVKLGTVRRYFAVCEESLEPLIFAVFEEPPRA